MPKLPCRKFTLLDAMILVAGLAVGLACVRTRLSWWRVAVGDSLIGKVSPMTRVQQIVDIAGFVLIPLSGLILIFRLRRPRPPLWRVARQPGSAACIGALIFVCGGGFSQLVHSAYLWGYHRDLFDANRIDFSELDWIRPIPEIAYAVAAIWLLFALGRIGRPEAGWIDRTGRFLGGGWIAWGLVTVLLNYYYE